MLAISRFTAMLEALARRWGSYVARGSRSTLPGTAVAINGLLFVLLAIFFVRSMVLLVIGFLIVNLGLHLFERAGLLMLMDEMRSQPNPLTQDASAGQDGQQSGRDRKPSSH
jgi:hypothetical protein